MDVVHLHEASGAIVGVVLRHHLAFLDDRVSLGRLGFVNRLDRQDKEARTAILAIEQPARADFPSLANR